jgi:DnaJ-class molecular chaperone
MAPILTCAKCNGEGSIFTSKHGGNDPDVWRAGGCEECGGSGNMVCEARGCTENAVAFNDDGEALCEDCLSEWASEEFG